MRATTIFYHADCLDGFGAACGAWRHFGDQACYRPMHHGEPWNLDDVAGHDVYILDFSFPPAKLQEIAQLAASVTQIDHHASAVHACAHWLPENTRGAIEFHHPALPLHLFFDLGKSGVRLSWEYFNPESPLPLALDHIEDQDLWRFRLPGTREFCRALRLLPFDLAVWDQLLAQTPDETAPRYREMLAKGNAIEVFFRNEVEHLADSRLLRPARLRGDPVDALQALRHGQAVISDGNQSWLAAPGLAVNANALFASELGNLLAEKAKGVGVVWQLAGDGEAKVSLRSQGELDVGLIATRYGGGGHRNAAGFRLPFAEFTREVLGMRE